MSQVQAVIFDNKHWDTNSARKWLKEHDMKAIKRVHKTTTLLRYRIHDPDKFDRFTTRTTKKGMSLIIGFYPVLWGRESDKRIFNLKKQGFQVKKLSKKDKEIIPKRKKRKAKRKIKQKR